jgi:hypothetical protein
MSLHSALKQCSTSYLGGGTHVCKYCSLFTEILEHQLLYCVNCQYPRSVIMGTFHWDLWPGAWCIPR